MSFFRAALERKVITVPGEFFDVNPGKRRGGRASRFRRHLRFSFGPPMARLELALERFRELIASALRSRAIAASRRRRGATPPTRDPDAPPPSRLRWLVAQGVVAALGLRAVVRRRRDAVRARRASRTPTR